MSTLFPEIRIKRVVELRGADAVDVPMTAALPALWVGLLYDPTARAEARRLIDVPFEDLLRFQESVARDGLEARLGSHRAEDLAREVVTIAAEGLRRQTERGTGEAHDSAMLDPLREVIESGRAPADNLLRTFQKTGGDRAALIASVRY
jgi:glutamate--cysteine ligase